MALVLVAEHGVEEWKGGMGGRGGAHSKRLRELSVNFLSQNVRGLSQTKEQELVAGMVMKGTFAAMVQETWRTGRTMEVDSRGFALIHNGLASKVCRRGSLGVAIVLSPLAKRAWEQGGSKVHFFGDRIIAARLQLEGMVGKPLIIVLVSAYAPHSGSTLEEKEAFAGNLQACINICGPDEILIMGIDANASIGTRSAHDKQGVGRDRVRGTHGIKDENEAGKKLHMLLGVHELCAASTFFQKRRYETWYHPGANWRGFSNRSFDCPTERHEAGL